METSHWIGSVTFELSSSDSSALDPVRHALREDHERILLRPLQRALDRVDRPDRVTRCRRIEVDLGLVRPGSLGELLERRIAEALHFELELENPAEIGGARGVDDEAQLLAYLETGHLAWPSPGKALEAICKAIERKERGALPGLADRLKRLFARHPQSAERFVRQCPLGLVIRIAAILVDLPDLPVAARLAGPAYARDEEAGRLGALIVRLAQGKSVRGKDRQWYLAFVGADPEAGLPRTAEGAPVVPSVPQPPGDRQADGAPAALLAAQEEWEGQAEGDMALPEALPLEAAGTALLYPFIAGMFRACGLLDGAGELSGDEARGRAVLLLHYAATDASSVAEPELALAKLLCGLDLATLVPRAFEPTEIEQAEVEAMLRAAISHWDALGDSSPEALRETFLKRPGRLQRERVDWRLIVEQRGVDILLDRLPWAVGLVVTPFMARPLRVEWR